MESEGGEEGAEETADEETETEGAEEEETEAGETADEEAEAEEPWVAETVVEEQATLRLTTAANVSYVAYIGGTGYETLAAAFAAADTTGSPTTIELAADIDLDRGTVTVPTGANVTLYGNGHTISNVGKIQVGTTSFSWTTMLNLGSADGDDKNKLTISGIDNNTNAIIYVNYSTLNMYDGVTLTGNTNTETGTSNGNQGGAVCAHHSHFNMFGGVISGNTSEYGGGVFVMGWNNDSFTMSGGEISGNSADVNGGGVACYGASTVTLSGGKISENIAAGIGGGLIVGGWYSSTMDDYYYTDCTIAGGEISGNVAGTYAGGMYFYGNSFTMNGGTITDNEAGALGGGLYVLLSSSDCVDLVGKITGGTISSNQSMSVAGGVYVYGISRATFTIENVTISDNIAGTGAGGLYLSGGAVYNLSGGTISNNEATTNGGGIYINNSTLNMSGGEISLNECAGVGGGIQNGGTFTETASCAIYNNTAATSGDDFYNESTGTFTLLAVLSGLTLDDCQHAITGWYYDGLGDESLTTRWTSHVTTEDKYCSEYTVSTTSVTDALALKAAHGGYHTITVNYLQNGTSTAIAAATTVSVPDTDAYTVSQKNISGYAYVSADRALTVAATADNVTINLYYEVSAEETDSDEGSSDSSASSSSETSSTSSSQTTIGSVPNTGDSAFAAAWLALAFISMSGILLVARRRI